jgi:hypothetical protein
MRNTRVRTGKGSRAAVRLALLVMLSTLPAEALAGDPAVTPDTKSREEPAAESAEGPSEPGRPSLRDKLLGATPEERARLEAERVRISAAAASFGTDPTAIIGYYELAYGHNAFTNNLRLDIAAAEVRVAVTPNFLLRVTVPYVWADLNGQRGFTTDSVGDTLVRIGGRVYANPNVAVLLGVDATFPTAENKLLGTGKYTLGPGASVAVPLARLRSLFITLVQDFNSVGGDPSRRNIHFMRVTSAVNTIWSERWWSIAGLQWNMDWNRTRKTTMNLQGEIGHRLDRHWNVFAGVGAGVVGRDTFLGLDWSAQIGVRWMIPGTLFQERVFEGLPRN